MSEKKDEEKRMPQPYDTISKGGNFWRITEIDEKGSVTAWRLYDGTVHKKGRPLRISQQKILDGTFRLLDIPPVTVTYQDPRPAPKQDEPKEPEAIPEKEPEKVELLSREYWEHEAKRFREEYEKTRKEVALAKEENRTLVAELDRRKADEQDNLETLLHYKDAWQAAYKQITKDKKVAEELKQMAETIAEERDELAEKLKRYRAEIEDLRAALEVTRETAATWEKVVRALIITKGGEE